MTHLTPWVRQYTLRDLLDESFDLFKERSTTLVLAVAFPYLLVILYEAVMRLFVYPGTFDLGGKTGWEALLENPDFLVYTTGWSAVFSVALCVGYIAQLRIATRHALGLPVSLRGAFRLLAKPFWSLLIVAIVYSIFLSAAMSVGFFVIAMVAGIISLAFAAINGTVAGVIFVVLGIIAATLLTAFVTALFTAAPVSLAIDHTGPFAALGKSFQLAGSNFKAYTWGLAFLLWIPTMFSLLITLAGYLLGEFTSTFSPTVTLLLGSVIGGFGNMALMGIIASFQALCYLDGRCRKENLDLLLLARQLDMGEEIEHAFLQGSIATTQTGYPNYAAMPASVIAMTPKRETTAPAAPGLTPPESFVTFPDYSAPPPPQEEPVPTAPQEGSGDDA